MEDICNRAEIPSDDREETEWQSLTQSDLKALVNEIMSIRSKNLLHIVPADTLSRMLKVLDRQIHRAEGLSIDDCEKVTSYTSVHSFSAYACYLQVFLQIVFLGYSPSFSACDTFGKKLLSTNRYKSVMSYCH